MEKIRTLRGFRDIIGEDIEKFRRIEDASRRYLELLGFAEIETPVLESTDLFIRSIGDTTDIVEKEMFTFTDLGGDSLTLRPEATAGVVRAYLQSGMYAKERISKLFTIGPMFRHERPQKGRFRQFHQVDAEVFGADDPFVDAELLWMISLILADLGVKKYAMEVNSVGCKLCREEFRAVLVSYFETRKDRLCEDCLRRLYRNPLRIFDCKNSQCIEVNSESPLLFDHLCGECGSHFNSFLAHMNGFGVSVAVNKRLVRGLDYYTRTVFEITSDELGAQKAFIAGGRYDNLVEEMGGTKTPAIGFAVGMERLALLAGDGGRPRKPVCFFAYLGEKAKAYLAPMTKAFIEKGLSMRYSYEERSLKSQMRYADGLGADLVLILGDEEISRNMIVVRNMKEKDQFELLLDPSGIAAELRQRFHKE
jgi:histidyl-tRNA synthetase